MKQRYRKRWHKSLARKGLVTVRHGYCYFPTHGNVPLMGKSMAELLSCRPVNVFRIEDIERMDNG